MDRLSIEQINSFTLPEQEVQVNELGGTVLVRAITARELSRAKRQATHRQTGEIDNATLTALIIEAGLKDPQLAPGQYKILLNLPIGPLNRISSVILSLSGIEEAEPEPEDHNPN